MCGTPMVEVRASHLRGHVWQEWQCPRCLHTEHDRYDDDIEEAEANAGPAKVN
jgi:hypothetical protein